MATSATERRARALAAEDERVAAAAAATDAQNAVAPTVDPLALAPWDRHDDVERPIDFARVAELMYADHLEVEKALEADPGSGREPITFEAAVQLSCDEQRA